MAMKERSLSPGPSLFGEGNGWHILYGLVDVWPLRPQTLWQLDFILVSKDAEKTSAINNCCPGTRTLPPGSPRAPGCFKASVSLPGHRQTEG